MAKKKTRTKTEKKHLEALVELGCIVCYKLGTPGTPAEIHHLRTGQGASQRASDYQAIPLCPWHHRLGGHKQAYHAGPKAFEERYGTEMELLELTQEKLGLL